MSTISPLDNDDPGEPLRGVDDLIAFFASAEKPPAQFRVGTEHEKFGFLRVAPDGSRLRQPADKSTPNTVERLPPLPFDGEDGIETLLNAIADDPDEVDAVGTPRWTRALDSGRVIALFGSDGASITLEPGGQFELSGAPLFTIHQTCKETNEHLQLLRKHSLARGIGFIGMGFHPTATWAEMPSVPKSRYGIMQRYMPTVGARGLDMMKRTATVQANYDWSSESDMVAGFRMSLAVSPIVAALFANSPFYEGKPTGAVSERQQVWADTDPNRAGFPQVVFDDGFSYARYVEWLLDVPMYFVRRDGVHHDVAGASFRTFMSEGLDVDGRRVRATLRDFSDHLTTVFPEVRVKRVLEVRAADCGPWSRICALPALYKGLLYDVDARAGATELMGPVTGRALADLRRDVAVSGFAAQHGTRSVLTLGRELVAIATAGLQRQAKAQGHDDESSFLAPLVATLGEGRTFAERLVDLYQGPWKRSLAPLWDEVEFWPNR